MLDALIYFVLLGLWSAIASYIIIFRIAPMFAARTPHSAHGDSSQADHGAPYAAHPAPVHHPRTEHGKRSFSAYEGFKSFAQGAELTVDDIVRGLSRND